ncbi:MAG: AraC family ligand binding domain-containing protein [Spirochaetales bacterium]|nr:AraC family ligand binding domain-containing protein [Spirochaetales bacterium]
MTERERAREERPYKDSFKNQFASMSSLTVYRSGKQRCAPGFYRSHRIYEFYILHYVTKGTGTYKINGKTYRVGPGDAFLIYPGVPIDKFTDSDNPWEYCWVGFNGTDAQMLMSMTIFSINTAVIKFDNPEIGNMIEEIYSYRGQQLYSIIKMTAKLYELLSYMVELSHKDLAHTDINDKYVSEASDFIGKNYSNRDLTVEMIAKYVCISRSRLFRAFKDTLNRSPLRFLEETRIREASILLQTTNFSIAEIADKVGYADPLYFSKVFRRVMGKTPTDFRKMPENPGASKNIVFDNYNSLMNIARDRS